MSHKRRIAHFCLTTILAGAGASVSINAQAQTGPIVDAPKPSAPASPIRNEDEEPDEILFEADSVFRDVEDGPIIAEGDVRAFFGERYLRADRLIYNPAIDVIIAEGNVSITDENMETAFAGRVELSGDLRDGIAENFSALLEDNTRLAAQSAIQEQGARTRLRRAVYTSCNICNNEGEGKTPTWRLRSLKVTRDRERRVMRFHHAFLEIKGVPIAYAPFLQTPDPSVERQSGFLPPNIGASDRLGFNFQLPYYLAISNNQDATFSPLYTAADGILWQGEWRRRGRKSYHVLAGGIIDAPSEQPEPTPSGNEGLPGVRWHYFGRGHHDFNDNWRVSYDFERVSDDEYLRNYNIERQGDLRQTLDRGSTNQLRSNARLAWNQGGSNLTIDSYLFQGLRGPEDDATTTPLVLPLIDYRYNFSDPLAGGKTSIGGNLAILQRTGGLDSRRFTANALWERDIITKGGHRFNLFAEMRGDLYHFDDLTMGTELTTLCENTAVDCASILSSFNVIPDDTSRFETRFAPTVGAEWSYPLTRELGNARLYLEPRVQLVASLANRNQADIINEDSQSIEFDYAGLFDYNKATGYDAFEDGQRANIGISASAIWQNGFTIEGAVGQQFRLQSSDAFDFASGLGETSSDIVGSLSLRYKSLLGIENRFRLDNSNAAIKRAESMAYFNTSRFRTSVSYVRLIEEDALNIVNDQERREELTARARLKLHQNWYAGSAWRIDLEDNQTIRQDFSLNYEDECSTFGVIFRRDETRVGNVQPDNVFLVSFTLKSLVE